VSRRVHALLRERRDDILRSWDRLAGLEGPGESRVGLALRESAPSFLDELAGWLERDAPPPARIGGEALLRVLPGVDDGLELAQVLRECRLLREAIRLEVLGAEATRRRSGDDDRRALGADLGRLDAGLDLALSELLERLVHERDRRGAAAPSSAGEGEGVRRESAGRQSFLLALSEALGPLSDPTQIRFAASRLLGEHVGAIRVVCAEIEDGRVAVVAHDWVSGARSIAGRLPVRTFGAVALAALRRGERVVVEDVREDPRLTGPERRAHLAAGIRAAVGYGVLREGRWVGALSVHAAAPRRWTAVELGLVQETAERTWAAVERARADQALRESERRLAAVVDQLPVAVGILDSGGRLVLSNAALRSFGLVRGPPSLVEEERLRWTVRDDRGRPLPPEQWPATRALRGETVPALDCTYRDGSGRERHAVVSAIPLRAGGGEQTGVLVVAQEVTRFRRAEAELRLANQHKADFLAMLSHELRNPLAPIRSSLYLLQHVPLESPQAARAREVLGRQAEHLGRLVDDLLDVTRISRGKIALRRVRVDLREVVRRATEDLRPIFDERGISLRVENSGGPATLTGDPVRLAQVLSNLLHNAAKFTPRDGTVTVALAAGGDARQATLSVRDTGEGMDPAQIERMFEPFTQAAQGMARARGGLGLGLALVRGFVELHGGQVRATSAGPGRGTEVVLTLPLDDAGPEPAAAPAEAPHPPAARDVLVVEDDADAAQTLADVLALHGNVVRIARDGRAALALARERPPDIILCDIGLPDVDGYEVAAAVRADPALRETRLVALTGYARPEDRDRAWHAGFDAHLAKPPQLDQLMALVGAVVPARRGGR
jgi:signal transduction histidine kinase/ActR/RegA family two-component response regulator